MGIDIVAVVEAMALREKQPLLCSTVTLFEQSLGVPINDDEEEELDYKRVHEAEPFSEENRAIMAQGNEILHGAGNVNEQLNLELAPYVNNEIVDAPDPIVD